MLDYKAYPVNTFHLSVLGLAELETRGEYGISRLQYERTNGGLLGGGVQSHSGPERFPRDHFVLYNSIQITLGGKLGNYLSSEGYNLDLSQEHW